MYGWIKRWLFDQGMYSSETKAHKLAASSDGFPDRVTEGNVEETRIETLVEQKLSASVVRGP